MTNSLFQPLQLGSISLNNRVVISARTRSRATQPGNLANEMMAKYYAQRATAGLIVTEGTQISVLGQGNAWTAGIYTPEQIAGWKKVTDAVHRKGGLIFAQLRHAGRITHPDNLGGEQPISCSTIKAENVKVFVDNGTAAPSFVDVVAPREMAKSDIAQVVEEYRQAALNAIEAGFDGIELDAANGYLINQFIDSEANNRTDKYGGYIENRLRFMGEVVGAIVDAIGADRVGVRLAPFTSLNGSVDTTPVRTYTAAAVLLNTHQVVYLNIVESDWDDAPETPLFFKQALREAFHGMLIYTGRYNTEKAEQVITEGVADMIAFGRSFIVNPELPNPIEESCILTPQDPVELFGAKKEITDYLKYYG